MTTITKLVNEFVTDSLPAKTKLSTSVLDLASSALKNLMPQTKQVWLLTLQARLVETTIENEAYQTL